MYNYISSIRKTSSVEICLKCFFINEEIPNLLLSKGNTIEIYDLSKEGLVLNKILNLYGKIVVLLNFPSSPDINTNHKDNIFILTEKLDYCVLSYDKISNVINTLFTGSIKEDLGKKQEKIIYSLDSDKNFLLISAYKNIYRLICLNSTKRLTDKYNDFIIRYQYEDVLFLSDFNVNKIIINKDDDKNKSTFLTFALVKTDLIENISNKENQNDNTENKDNNNIYKRHEISLETFQIKVEPTSFNIYYYEKKNELLKNNKNIALKVTSNRKANYKDTSSNSSNNKANNSSNRNNNNTDNKKVSNTHDKMLEHMNLIQKIDLTENPTVSLMITHPDGLIILFFSNYALYYKYDLSKKELICDKNKKISYPDRKFINYAIIDEKNYKYFITDEYGNLFLLAFIDPFNIKEQNSQFILQILGEINYSTSLVYLDNNYIFNGSNKSSSQLIKIENKNNSLINVVKNYESLSPIKDFAIINDMEEESGIEILTISGIEKGCAIKKIKKGSPVVSFGELIIKNIRDVFKININNKEQVYSFIITTITKSFIIDYNYNKNEVSINKKIDLKNGELVLHVENINNNLIVIATNLSIKIYNNDLKLITNRYIEENNKNIYPLIVKYNKKLNKLYVYSNDKSLKSFKIDKNGKISEVSDILKNVYICSFDVCKYFIIYSLWDSNKLYIYSFKSKVTKTLEIPEEPLDYTKISSIQIFKNESIHYIFISLSNGKIIYFQLKKSIKSYKDSYTFSEQDFIFKRKYNLNFEDISIKKIKQKNKNSLFINSQNPTFIFFNKDTPVVLYFNIKNCKNLIEFDENIFLFVFNDKISFGCLSNIQSQNIYSKSFDRQLNCIKLISFGVSNNSNESNKSKHYILTIEENKIGNVFKNSLVLSDLYLKEISRYNFEYQNEESNTFSEVSFFHGNFIDSKLIVIGTSIIENQSKEAVKGHLYLIEINQNNNYSMKKIGETETRGGIHKIISCKNIIYTCIGNILYIYKLKQSIENSFEFQLIKKCSEFILINDLYIWDERIDDLDIKNEFSDSKNNLVNKEKENNNIIIDNTNIQYLIISDLNRSIGIYSYDIDGNKLSEICRDYSNTWVYSVSQLRKDLLYLTDIEGNIVSLIKNNNPKKENDEIKLNRIAYYNYGERISSMKLTKIKNKDLFKLTPEYNKDDDENGEEVKIVFFVTLEGSVGQIVQINKDIFSFLKSLQDLLIKSEANIGEFNYYKWKNYYDGNISKESNGFIEGDIFEKFLNNDEVYKKKIIKQLNYPWNKSYHEVIKILEILANNH